MFVQNHHRAIAVASAAKRRSVEQATIDYGTQSPPPVAKIVVQEEKRVATVRAYGRAEFASEDDDPVEGDGNHPDCRKLWFVSQENGSVRRVPVNRVYEFSTEHAFGAALLMVRTPDDDDDEANVVVSPAARTVAEHLRRNDRRFEFQFRFRLRRPIPTGSELYAAVELEDGLGQGFVQRALAATVLAFLRSCRDDLHATLESWHGDDDGERAHVAFPALACFDRLAITPPGETPPELGTNIPEDPASVQLRLSGRYTPLWDTETTYTAAVFGHNIDLLRWRAYGVPGLPPINFVSLLGNQAINSTIYCLEKDKEKDMDDDGGPLPHTENRKSYISRLEISLEGVAVGTQRRRWERIASSNTDETATTISESYNDDDDDVDSVLLRDAFCGCTGGSQRESFGDSLLWKDLSALKHPKNLRRTYKNLLMKAINRVKRITADQERSTNARSRKLFSGRLLGMHGFSKEGNPYPDDFSLSFTGDWGEL